jgi:transposase-like protein
MSNYQRYTREFKIEAMRLLAQGEKPASEIARSLGIRRNQLYKWRDNLPAQYRSIKGAWCRRRDGAIGQGLNA